MTPFLKWAGGKRWLFDASFIAQLPPFKRYIEPFLGGAAGFFALGPKAALLSDINPELIELYCAVRDFPLALRTELQRHQRNHSKEYYYIIRQEIHNDPIKRAARMLYLNRTCWNGLYRLNKKGIFNVPIGTKNAVILPSDDFEAYSNALKNADLKCCDFEQNILRAKKGDLLFVDPPYTVKHNMNGFIKYNEVIFSWNDQVRLRNSLLDAAERGANIILTNADHDSVRDLYCDIGIQKRIERASVISGKSEGRARITELMVIA